MGKNIVIFSDGTGQRAGLTFDERRSNIYKLFRATRCGPDTKNNPAEQVTFYDAGIGTVSPGAGTLRSTWNWIYNKVCQATGLGLTTNLVECYAAIIREWEEGDRIFLFGFSRGAYTMRLLGGVLAHCGVPTKERDSFLPIDEKGAKKIAKRAVVRVYQHSASKIDTPEKPLTEREKKFLDQRKLLAAEFRKDYGSFDKDATDQSNAVPHFIGVFDTVASVFHRRATAAIAAAALIGLGLISLLVWFMGGGFWLTFIEVFVFGLTCLVMWFVHWNMKFPGGIGKYHWWETIRPTWQMHFEDTELSDRVPYARHAIAIDENRKLFKRVPWGRAGMTNDHDAHGVLRFKQVWFSGVHTDIGGGYPEPESRLSDIALEWMLEDVQSPGIDLKIDWSYLNLFPDATGRQHDEYAQRMFWRLAGKKMRIVPPDAPLHDSVRQRYLAGGVRHYHKTGNYRPPGLVGDPERDDPAHENVAIWEEALKKVREEAG